MIQWLIIALRNIRKNRRRSLVTLMAIAMGFAAISLFRGYTASTYEGLRQSAIRGEGLGHFTIYKAGWIEKGKTDPAAFMFTENEFQDIVRLVEEDDQVYLATPQIHISGLVSNGFTSAIFLAKGVIPRDYRTILGAMAKLRSIKGEGLRDAEAYKVVMATDLADQLSLKNGNDAVVMTTTLDGQMNALDIHIAGIYDTGSDATNDKYMLFPFSHAQSLYDTRKADRIVVLIDNWKNTAIVKNRLISLLEAEGFACEIKQWDELSLFYLKVKGMFDMIFWFLFLIVLIIVVMSTVNTMGMAVMERTREIGTLRALGLKRRGVNFLFALEGALLGCFGSLLGIALNVAAWVCIRVIEPTYIPPGISSPVPLIVNLVPRAMVLLMVFLISLSLVAAILPARRAARQNVVEALGHV